jgi:hypothetical protein
MEYADACSHPVQPCSTIVLLVSVRQDVHQLIGLRALLGALRSCRNEGVAYARVDAQACITFHVQLARLRRGGIAGQPFYVDA